LVIVFINRQLLANLLIVPAFHHNYTINSKKILNNKIKL
jgi:hypothetical protein